MDGDKRLRIINASLREFGRIGYKKTSAEQLAKSSGIGKGMIFHYFGTKLGLYEYLFEYTGDMLDKWWGGLEERLERLDYIEQYRLITRVKLQAYTESPYIFEFLTMVYTQPENLEVSERAKAIYDGAIKVRGEALAQIASSKNTGLFREDMDVDKAKRYVGWLVDGYANNLLAILGRGPLADVEIGHYWDEFDEILDDCKKVFYKV